jgi:hypothetical protein
VITLLLIGTGVVISGGPHSPALPWMALPRMVLPAGMVAARFYATAVELGRAQPRSPLHPWHSSSLDPPARLLSGIRRGQTIVQVLCRLMECIWLI